MDIELYKLWCETYKLKEQDQRNINYFVKLVQLNDVRILTIRHYWGRVEKVLIID